MVGALVRSKGMTMNSYAPYVVTSSLRLISFRNPHLIVSRSQIKLGKVLSLSNLVEKVRNQWDGILVLHGQLVEGPVVNTQSKRAIMLLLKENRHPIWCL